MKTIKTAKIEIVNFKDLKVGDNKMENRNCIRFVDDRK